MPYAIRKRNDQWCVVRLADENRSQRTVGCHPTQEQAERQLRAVRASEHADE